MCINSQCLWLHTKLEKCRNAVYGMCIILLGEMYIGTGTRNTNESIIISSNFLMAEAINDKWL